MTDTPTGRFVWYELMTSDPAAARAFYSALFGWKTEPFGDEGYAMWVGGQGPLGGVLQLPEEARAMGAPPHWTGHVTVAGVDAAVAKAKALGGKVYVVEDIPTVGRIAVLGDPQGAVVALFTPDRAMPEHDAGGHGEVCWRELITTDPPAALAFYGAIAGWERAGELDLGPMGTYTLFGHAGGQVGGIFARPKELPGPPRWLYYFNVRDLDEALALAKAKGATVLDGPRDIPGGARVAQLQDPQGAAFALHSMPARPA